MMTGDTAISSDPAVNMQQTTDEIKREKPKIGPLFYSQGSLY
jgi:hypothetical protein